MRKNIKINGRFFDISLVIPIDDYHEKLVIDIPLSQKNMPVVDEYKSLFSSDKLARCAYDNKFRQMELLSMKIIISDQNQHVITELKYDKRVIL